MAQLRPGAAEALAHLISDLEWMKEKAYNPEAVIAYADKCIERLNAEIRPRLQRAEPTLEQRLNEQGEQHRQDIEELRRQIALLASQQKIVLPADERPQQ